MSVAWSTFAEVLQVSAFHFHTLSFAARSSFGAAPDFISFFSTTGCSHSCTFQTTVLTAIFLPLFQPSTSPSLTFALSYPCRPPAFC